MLGMLGICFALASFETATFSSSLIFLVSVPSVWFVLRYDKHKREERAVAKANELKTQLALLEHGLWPAERVFKATCRSFTIYGLLGVAMTFACMLVWLESQKGWVLLSIVLTGVITLIFLGRSIATIGDNYIELSTQGLKGQGWGLIPWRAVEGIYLQELRAKGSVVSYLLQFRVPDLSERLSSTHFLIRFTLQCLPKCPTVVSYSLNARAQAPLLIEAVARKLWFQETGRSYQWLPSASNEFNHSLRMEAEIMAKLPLPQQVGSLDRQGLQNYSDAIGTLANLRKVQQGELYRRAQATWWILGLAIVGIATTFGVKYFK